MRRRKILSAKEFSAESSQQRFYVAQSADFSLKNDFNEF